MTSTSRRALPWLVSIGAHLSGLVVVAVLLAHPAGIVPAPRVDITFAGAPGAGRGALRSGPAPAGGATAPMQSPAAAPAGEQSARQSPASADAAAVPGSRWMPYGSLPAPAASDVLADTAAVSPGSTGSPSGTVVGWEGVQRKLIRKRNPEFPTVLSAIGQEIEGEARINVDPSGNVTRVEITRSSGYIEIDASVAEALRYYLFSRVEGRIETVGTVHFRFRLEKQD
jgi:TonB family protein